MGICAVEQKTKAGSRKNFPAKQSGCLRNGSQQHLCGAGDAVPDGRPAGENRTSRVQCLAAKKILPGCRKYSPCHNPLPREVRASNALRVWPLVTDPRSRLQIAPFLPF
jgi:hypothetical protein